MIVTPSVVLVLSDMPEHPGPHDYAHLGSQVALIPGVEQALCFSATRFENLVLSDQGLRKLLGRFDPPIHWENKRPWQKYAA